MAKIRLEDIQVELNEIGWKCVSTEYINLDSQMEFLCDEGHHIFSTWKKLRTHKECPICSKNQFKNQNEKIIPKRKDEFRVLALDQATKISGYSIFSNKKLIKFGTFEVDDEDEIARDHKIKEWLISMIKIWQIDYVGLEGIQYQQDFGVTTFETLARLQGILMETLYELNIPYKICPTNTWRAHCGVKGKTRNDKKTSMKLLVKKWFDVKVTDDCADAIGIGKYTSETSYKQVEMVKW